MKRPVAHEIETRSRQVFERSIPPGWVARSQTPDYGVDYDVEVFKAETSTGVTFKIQLKGSERLLLGQDHFHIGYALETDSAKYLCEELTTPTILAVVDLATETVYWTAPQLDKDLRARLGTAIKEGKKSLVAHVPVANTLPPTTDALLNAVADAQILIGTRTVQHASIPSFARATAGRFDPDVLVRELTTKAAVVRVQQIRTLYTEDKLDEARATLEQILAMPDADLGVKFAALGEVEKQEMVRFRYPPDTFDALAKLRLSITARMRQISGDGPVPLRLYALIALKAAELQMLAFDDRGLYYNWVAQQATGGLFWKLELSLKRQRTRVRLVRGYRQCIRLVNLALRSGYQGILPEAAERILVAMMLFVISLDNEGLAAPARDFRDSLLQLADIAVDVATEAKHWDELGVLVGAGFRLSAVRKDPETIAKSGQWAEERLQRIPAQADREGWLALHQKHRSALERKDFGTEDSDRTALEQQIYRTMAEAIGIDLTDPEDPFAIMVRQGLKDLNPERALRHCKHLFFSLGPGGLPVLLIQLPTAGFKRLRCTAHGYGVEDFALDDCSEVMQREFCSKCSDRAPREPDWKWTPEWQQQQNAQFGHLADDENWR